MTKIKELTGEALSDEIFKRGATCMRHCGASDPCPRMTALTFAQFHNALRILRSIDLPELQEAGVMVGASRHSKTNVEAWSAWLEWSQFREEPYLYFIRCDDDTAAVIWKIIEGRQQKNERT